MKKLFVAIALIVTIIPALFVINEVGGLNNWRGVLPEGITDSLYYYGRIHEVADGHPLIGNPYAYEYRDSFPPAFFLPDIVASIPVLIGLPFDVAMLVNIFVWSFIFLILSFSLFRSLKFSTRWSLIWSTILFLSSYSFILRPVVMQMVFPLFLAFLITVLKFLENPHKPRNRIALFVVSAITFYVYTYLAFIAVLTFGLIFFWYLYKRYFKELKSLIITGVGLAVLLIPFAVFTFIQMSNANYIETINRIGLVYTHIPAIEALYYGRWVVLGLGIFFLMWKFSPRARVVEEFERVFWFATGGSLFVGVFLNVITGVELTLAIHIGRFVILWMVIALGAILYHHYQILSSNFDRKKFLLIAILVLILSAGVARNIPRALVFFLAPDQDESVADLQMYAAPLLWLDEYAEEESVVWANNTISMYIPILTKHYPLFASSAALGNISDYELEDRYLLSNTLNKMTVEDLEQNFGRYSAAGSNKEKPLAQNRHAWLCGKTKVFIKDLKCPPHTDAISLRGEAYFTNLLKRFQTIKEKRLDLMRQFDVRYLIIDSTNDHFEQINLAETLYDDGRFSILRLPL